MKRVVFSFDDSSYLALKEIQKLGNYPDLASALSHCIQITKGLQQQNKLGFSELVVHNPKTNSDKTTRINW